MKKFRVGVVGLGHRGRLMFSLACNNFECAIPAAACDLLPRNWYETQWLMDEPMCETFPDTEFYNDYNKMLDEANLDVVIVETGADVHAEFCKKALEKNINVLTDIPVVANLQEAKTLWDTAQKSNAMISVGANPNEAKFSVLLQDYYKQGKLGKPYYMEAEYIHWFKDAEGIKGLHENGEWRRLLSPIRYCTHSLGPLLTIVSEELRYVSCFATGQHAKPEDYPANDITDDMQSALFRTESGITCRILRNGRCRALLEEHSYRVFGTEGYMERIAYGFDNDIPEVIRFNSTVDDDEKLHEVSGEFMPPEYVGIADKKMHGGIDYALFDHFFKALTNGDAAPIPLKAGLEMTIPGIFAEESAKRGGELLKITYPWDENWTGTFD